MSKSSNLIEPISGDEYVRVVLVQRQKAWLAAHPDRTCGTAPSRAICALNAKRETKATSTVTS